MKKIRYTFGGDPALADWTEENEVIIRNEADGGEIDIFDDGVEGSNEPKQEQRIAELEEALELLLLGVTE